MSVSPINGTGPTQGQRNTLTSKSLSGSKSLLLFSPRPRIIAAGSNLGETVAFSQLRWTRFHFGQTAD